MDTTTDKTIKYYRVILECVDPKKETPASFAIKLSMRARTPMPRVQQVLRNLPYCLKSGLSVKQATRWKSVLEEIGAIARIEEHYETRPSVPSPASATPEKKRGPELLPGVEGGLPTKTRICASCGWGESPEAEICSFCLQPFEAKREEPLDERLPEVNPLGEPGDGTSSIRQIDFGDLWQRHKRSIAIGAVIALIIFLIIK